jgi:hypothetical protein
LDDHETLHNSEENWIRLSFHHSSFNVSRLLSIWKLVNFLITLNICNYYIFILIKIDTLIITKNSLY